MIIRTALLAALSVLVLSPAAPAWDRGEATTFARLPQPERNPEGIALDKKTGDVYVADFDFRGTKDAMGHVIVFNKQGKLLRVVSVKNSSPALLGLDFHPTTHALLVIDFGMQQVLTVDPVSGDSTVFTKLDPAAGPNALTFDKGGNVYISDSFQGIIWRTPPTGGPATRFASSPLLTTTGKPPFGANGMAFNHDFSFLFVANTGNDSILKIPASGSPVVEFTNSINGADGLAIDEHDNIWVCANQADEIVVVDQTGKAIAKLGDFDGISARGEPRGFLTPASLVFSGEFVLVTNLALDTRLFGFNSVDAQWAAQVKTYTVAKIKRRIPNLPDRHDDD
ncbi:MAG: SMP-30/gluconolactonase/LRE family protein [Myxococcales bacterium]